MGSPAYLGLIWIWIWKYHITYKSKYRCDNQYFILVCHAFFPILTQFGMWGPLYNTKKVLIDYEYYWWQMWATIISMGRHGKSL